MKQFLLLFTLCFSIATQAQITVTNSIFPQAGDVLETSTTTNYNTVVSVSAASATAQSWDFSMLTSNFPMMDSIRPASSGNAFAQFPNTEILRPLLSLGISYVDVTANSMQTEGAGIEIPNPTGGTINIVAPFLDPIQLQNAPLTYNTNYLDTFALSYSNHVDSIPGLRALLDSLSPIAPDSIRVNLDGTKNANVDAFGTLMTYDTTYDVIRQKVTRYSYITVETYVVILGNGSWQDVTGLISGALPIPLNDTTIFYDHLAEGVKEPIVRINMNTTESAIQSIQFKGQNLPSSVRSVAQELAHVELFPNPATEQFQLQTNTIDQPFNLQIVDMNGKICLQRYHLTEKMHKLDVRDLPQGLYQVILTSNNGQLLARKTLSITK